MNEKKEDSKKVKNNDSAINNKQQSTVNTQDIDIEISAAAKKFEQWFKNNKLKIDDIQIAFLLGLTNPRSDQMMAIIKNLKKVVKDFDIAKFLFSIGRDDVQKIIETAGLSDEVMQFIEAFKERFGEAIMSAIWSDTFPYDFQDIEKEIPSRSYPIPTIRLCFKRRDGSCFFLEEPLKGLLQICEEILKKIDGKQLTEGDVKIIDRIDNVLKKLKEIIPGQTETKS